MFCSRNAMIFSCYHAYLLIDFLCGICGELLFMTDYYLILVMIKSNVQEIEKESVHGHGRKMCLHPCW